MMNNKQVDPKALKYLQGQACASGNFILEEKIIRKYKFYH